MIRLIVEAGDRVKLRAGGRTMIVESVQDGTAYCSWLDEPAGARHESFGVKTLKHAADNIAAPVGREVSSRVMPEQPNFALSKVK